MNITFLFLLALCFTASSVLPGATSIRTPYDVADSRRTFDEERFGEPDSRRTFDDERFGESISGNRFDAQQYGETDSRRTFDDERFGGAVSGNRFYGRQYGAVDTRNKFDSRPFGAANSGNRFDSRPFGPATSGNRFDSRPSGGANFGNTVDSRPFGGANSGNRFDSRPFGGANSGNRFDSRPFGAEEFGAAKSGGTTFDVQQYGARGDGATDNSKAFLAAWNAACSSTQASTINIPRGNFLVDPAVFTGPCKSNSITVQLSGNLIQPSGFTGQYWLQFTEVDGLTIQGDGHLDGQGASWWNACQQNGRCTQGPASLRLAGVTNGVLRGITSINSKQFHFTIDSCDTVLAEGLTIQAPADSPNTDGIHIDSQNVHLRNINIATGDDCIGILEGTSNLLIENIKCGPGHGISVGSLGRYPSLNGVTNVTVSGVQFIGTMNGIRIKTLQGGKGAATDFTFENIVMKDVQNPIIIDQYYCPSCSGQKSSVNDNSPNVRISGVVYRNITGTSATKEAINFGCSRTVPCQDIQVQDVSLTFGESAAVSRCNNANIVAASSVNPPVEC